MFRLWASENNSSAAIVGILCTDTVDNCDYLNVIHKSYCPKGCKR